MAITGTVLLDTFATFDPSRVESHPRFCTFSPGAYFILVGGEDPRKNTRNVLAAQARLTRQGVTLKLLIVGKYEPVIIERLVAFHQAEGGRTADLQFVHGVEDGVLGALYHRARACICPSKSEGFSMPVIEAMACGTAVLASNCPAQLELVEQADALFDYDDVEGMAQVMQRAQQDDAWLASLRQSQRGIAQRFYEKEVAARLWQHVRRHLPGEHWPSRAARRARPRLALLTPYPAQGNHETNFIPTLARELAQSASVTVCTHERQPRPDPWIQDFQPLSDLAHIEGQFDKLVTVLGFNDHLMRYFTLAERYGGPCLLYQASLGQFYATTFGWHRLATVAERALARSVSRSELQYWVHNFHDSCCRFLSEVSRWSAPLITHSRLARAELDRQSAGSATFLAPCWTEIVEEAALSPENRARARQCLGLDPSLIHIAHLDPIDPAFAQVIVYALEHFRSWGYAAHLHLAGDMSEVKPLAQRLGLAECVHEIVQLGSDQRRQLWYSAADLGTCLRTADSLCLPERLMPMLASGVPTIVNREVAEGFQTPSYVCTVPDLPSSVLIAEQWLAAVTRNLHLERLSEARSQFAAERHPQRYARSLWHLLEAA